MADSSSSSALTKNLPKNPSPHHTNWTLLLRRRRCFLGGSILGPLPKKLGCPKKIITVQGHQPVVDSRPGAGCLNQPDF